MRQAWSNRQTETGACDGCSGCSAPYPLGGLGNLDSNVMMVAKEPNYNVDEDGVDMEMNWHTAKHTMEQNRSDSMNPLWKLFTSIQIANDGREPYFTNLAKCTGGSWGDRVSHCDTYFNYEYAEVDPELILLFGKPVTQRVFGKFGFPDVSSITRIHAKPYEHGRITIVPFTHWGYAYRNGTVTEFTEDVIDAVKSY